MDFFLSYHHDDKRLAGKVKQELLSRRSTGFLAHEDINPSKTWREEILRNLRSCTALIAIVTPNFPRSPYANQEVGYVLSKGKPVISFNFDTELPGFLESIQAVPTSESNIGNAVDRAIEVIQGREPSVYIEPAFKSASEIEDIAVNELMRHFIRISERVMRNNIPVNSIALNQEKGIFDISGTATGPEKAYSTRSGIVTASKAWGWKMQIDARTGSILGKSVTPI